MLIGVNCGTIAEPGVQMAGGYAAFTVSASAREDVRGYIARQEEHHRKKTSREEQEEFPRKFGVLFDERYFD